MNLFNTALEYKSELVRIQKEQIDLMANSNMRLKVNRLKKQSLTEQFFSVKEDWRDNLKVENHA